MTYEEFGKLNQRLSVIEKEIADIKLQLDNRQKETIIDPELIRQAVIKSLNDKVVAQTLRQLSGR